MLFRKIVVALLLVSTCAAGCAAQRESIANAWAQKNDQLHMNMLDWLDEHPVVKGTVYCVCLAALAAGVAAIFLFAPDRSDSNQAPPKR